MFTEFKGESIIKRAIDKGVCSIEIIDIRQYSHLKHKNVDDTPCGGGAGMVLKVDIVTKARRENANSNSYIAMMTPQGRQYNQEIAIDLSKKEELILLCGHYEGFDERIRAFVDDEISTGKTILNVMLALFVLDLQQVWQQFFFLVVQKVKDLHFLILKL